MRYAVLGLTCAFAVACVETETDDSDATPCSVTVMSTVPENENQRIENAYYRTTLAFHLSNPDAAAAVAVAGVDGTSSRNEDDTVVYFTPATSFAPNTNYTATLTYCQSETWTLDISTSDVGEPLAEPEALVGAVYRLNFANGTVVIPERAGAVLAQYFNFSFLMSPVAVNASSLEMLVALADAEDPSEQSWCTPTVLFADGPFDQSDGFFSIGPADLGIPFEGSTIVVQDLTVEGTFSADGGSIEGAVLEGNIDTRLLAPLIIEGASEDAICQLLQNFGDACTACRGSGEAYCMDLKSIDLVAQLLTTSDGLESVALDNCHALCSETWVEETSDTGEPAWVNANEDCTLEYSENQ